jgi:hypothetical protein
MIDLAYSLLATLCGTLLGHSSPKNGSRCTSRRKCGGQHDASKEPSQDGEASRQANAADISGQMPQECPTMAEGSRNKNGLPSGKPL